MKPEHYRVWMHCEAGWTWLALLAYRGGEVSIKRMRILERDQVSEAEELREEYILWARAMNAYSAASRA